MLHPQILPDAETVLRQAEKERRNVEIVEQAIPDAATTHKRTTTSESQLAGVQGQYVQWKDD